MCGPKASLLKGVNQFKVTEATKTVFGKIYLFREEHASCRT